MDYVDKQKWINKKRFKENEYETPISKNGSEIAKNTILSIFNIDDRNIGCIFSSPAERCIQTALQFQKQIYKHKKILVPIKIENGLVFFSPCLVTYKTIYEYNDNKIKVNNNQFKIIDYYMEPNEIYKRYGENRFDTDYKPIVSIDQVNENSLDYEKSIDRVLKTIIEINKNSDNKNLNIGCTHGECIL